MKYLAIDYGTKRVGIAVSDMDGHFAFPRCTLKRETKAAFWEEFLALLEKERPDALVLGIPFHVDGSECMTTRQARNFAQSLKRRVVLPIYWVDEVLSSNDAEQRLYEQGLGFAKVKEVVDQHAAAVILESFLELPEDRRQTV